MLLLDPIIRSSKEKLIEIIDVNFIEHTSSGNVYRYKEDDVFPSNFKKITILDFEIKIINDETILATYKSKKYISDNSIPELSLRSSIWIKIEDKWKLLFHQGTNCKVNKQYK